VRLGFTFNVRSAANSNGSQVGLADDAQEEFDSQETIDAIADALRSLGHDVELLGDGKSLLKRLLGGSRPDMVFNMAEGTGIGRSREARVPALLEMLDIPHTGSDPLTLAVALDKPLAKTLVAAAGVAVPRGVLVEAVQGSKFKVQGSGRPSSKFQVPSSKVEDPRSVESDLGLRPPLIAKPAFEGSSKGVLGTCVIENENQAAEVVTRLLDAYRQPVLVEEFIDGEELTVGVLGNAPPQVVGVMRVVPRQSEPRFVYSLEVKRDWENRVRYECPAQLSPLDQAAVEEAALAAFRALGCRDVARIDFRLRDSVPHFIEANPLPGLSPKSSDLVIMARALGIEHRELLRSILEAAFMRYQLK
jgi:D-alanine-D-alanine ligase